MSFLKRNLPAAAAGLYLLAVSACIVLAFDFEGSINSNWTLALIALTLPWSLVSVLFMWALIHGAGLGCFAVMYLAFAVVNVFIIHRILSAVRTPKGENEQSSDG